MVSDPLVNSDPRVNPHYFVRFVFSSISFTFGCCSVSPQRVSKSKNIIQGKCVACGSRFQFDDTHAVGNFIKKNPPTDEHSIATKYAVD